MNINAHTCSVNDVPLSLTPTEFKIVQALCEKKGMVVTSEELFKAVWQMNIMKRIVIPLLFMCGILREKNGGMR